MEDGNKMVLEILVPYFSNLCIIVNSKLAKFLEAPRKAGINCYNR